MSLTPSYRTTTGHCKPKKPNSKWSQNVRSPNKLLSLYKSGLSLQTVIGTTVSVPTAFDTLSSPCIFAYTAGAAAVVVNADENSKYTQRFFKANPTAVPTNPTTLSSTVPGAIASDGRNRSLGGSNRDTTFSCLPISPLASSDWGADSSTSKTLTSRERIKAATCLSLSPDGNLLAVGETGYAPRVLIFSLSEDSSDSPLAIINEHAYGVKAVAFSPDSRYLASLGNMNDGFLYIWSINQKTGTVKLNSSNKCTNLIRQMVWLGDSKIVTVGTRHIKIWRMTAPQRNTSPTKPKSSMDGPQVPAYTQVFLKALKGRNVILGPLVDVTFTSLTAISNHRAIVCSEKGDICLIDDSRASKLLRLTNTGLHITCIAVNLEARQVQIGGKNGKKICMNLDDLLSADTPPTSPKPSKDLSSCSSGHICAMGYAGRRLVTVDTNHLIEITLPDSYSINTEIKSKPFPGHSDAVLGVHLLADNPFKADFLTWSTSGTVMFWDLSGSSKGSINVGLKQSFSAADETVNQCLNLRVSKGAEYIIYGDRYGVLKIIKLIGQILTFETRAHSSDINDIELHEASDSSLLATCGRDRTVQLFRFVSERWSLVQTLDDHLAAVTSLSIAENANKLISSSIDRTVHIRQITRKVHEGIEDIIVLPLRIITLKSSPASLTPIFTEKVSNLIVSLQDRTIATYEISTGRLLSSFKASDNDSIDAVSLDSLAISTLCSNSAHPTIFAGVSSTDKSVRVYDGITGICLDKEWGHTANVTDLALYEYPNSDLKTVISTGSDGTIMIWSLSPNEPNPIDGCSVNSNRNETVPAKTMPLNSRVPLRRVLSKVELSGFRKEIPSLRSDNNKSPSETLRKKTSQYGTLKRTPSYLPLTNLATKGNTCVLEKSPSSRSRSPKSSPKSSNIKRSSLSSMADTSKKKKSSPNLREFVSLNTATEQTCCALRAYRKRLHSSDSIRESSLKELDQELRLTAVALGNKNQKSQIVSEATLTELLDQYSDRLVSMLDEKLQLSWLASNRSFSEEPESINTSDSISAMTDGEKLS